MTSYLDYPIRLKKDGITFSVSALTDVGEHTHEFLEIAYVGQGRIEHFLNGNRQVLSTGDYIIMDYDTRHSYRRLGEEPIQIINCLFLPEFIDKTLTGTRSLYQVLRHYLIKMSGSFTLLGSCSWVFHENGAILPLITRMQREYNDKKPGYLEILRGNLIELMIQTLRGMEPKLPRADRICDSVIQFVNDRYAQNISLSELAAELNYSLPYISRKFKEDTGMTFSDYLQRVRVEQSCRLLANTEKSILEIAQLVGYADTKFFNFVFKKHRNMTPRAFRKLTRSVGFE